MDYDHVAAIYDSYVTADYDIAFFLQEVRAAQGPVLELMAGTGRVSLPLAEAGAALCCVDLSAPMLGQLEAKLRPEHQVRTVRADLRRLELGERFGLALIPFNAFMEIVDRDDQLLALRAIRRHLAPGGELLLTLHNPALRRRGIDGRLSRAQRLALPEGSLVFWSQLDEEPGGLVTGLQFMEVYDAQGLMLSRRMQELRFALIERRDFEALAAEAGFEIRELLGDYERSAFDPQRSPTMIWRLAATR